MGWQLTAVARRVQRLLGLGGGFGIAAHGAADPVARRAGEVLAALTPADRTAFETWAGDRPEAAAVLTRTLAAAGRLAPVAELATAWDGWDDEVRAAVADPVRALTADARQTDPTTCGSASLVLLAAAGDPRLAAWLATGWRPARGGGPAELSGAVDRALAVLADRPPAVRFGVLQQVVKRRTNAGALGPVSWPASLGTPPWGAARVARYPGVRWVHRMVDDTDPAEFAAVWDRVLAAVRLGVPVPLYSGGDTAGGLGAAVPRHVVLAVGAADGELKVFEPSAGRIRLLARGSTGPRPALGGWSHLVWAVLPVLPPLAPGAGSGHDGGVAERREER